MNDPQNRWENPMQPPVPNPGQGPYQQGGPMSGPGGPLTSEERNWGMGAHLAGFVGYVIPFGHIIGPLIVWLMKRDTSAFVDDQGKEALNFNISMTIYFLICIAFAITIIGLIVAIPGFLVLGAFDIIVRIIAGVQASNGERYRCPLTIRFLS
jgi:uncharacterized Tic20 family protein